MQSKKEKLDHNTDSVFTNKIGDEILKSGNVVSLVTGNEFDRNLLRFLLADAAVGKDNPFGLAPEPIDGCVVHLNQTEMSEVLTRRFKEYNDFYSIKNDTRDSGTFIGLKEWANTIITFDNGIKVVIEHLRFHIANVCNANGFLKPSVITFGLLNNYHNLDECDDEQMSILFSVLKDLAELYDCLVFVCLHERYGVYPTKPNSVFGNYVDGVIALTSYAVASCCDNSYQELMFLDQQNELLRFEQIERKSVKLANKIVNGIAVKSCSCPNVQPRSWKDWVNCRLTPVADYINASRIHISSSDNKILM